MNKKTHTILTSAFVFFVVTASIFAYIFLQIYQQGSIIEESKKAIGEQQAKENAYNKVEKLLELTKQDRDHINGYFLNESDAVSFITSMEQNAKMSGVILKTNALSIQPASLKDGMVTEPPKLLVNFAWTGNKNAVENFQSLLENLPYDTQVTSLSLIKNTPLNWTATIILEITMQYD
jgi:hypothetical protein